MNGKFVSTQKLNAILYMVYVIVYMYCLKGKNTGEINVQIILSCCSHRSIQRCTHRRTCAKSRGVIYVVADHKYYFTSSVARKPVRYTGVCRWPYRKKNSTCLSCVNLGDHSIEPLRPIHCTRKTGPTRRQHQHTDCIYSHHDGFGGLVVSMLASGTHVCVFKPGRSRWIFRT